MTVDPMILANGIKEEKLEFGQSHGDYLWLSNHHRLQPLLEEH